MLYNANKTSWKTCKVEHAAKKKCVSFWLTVNYFTVYIGLQLLFILEVNDLSKLYSSMETILIQLKQTWSAELTHRRANDRCRNRQTCQYLYKYLIIKVMQRHWNFLTQIINWCMQCKNSLARSFFARTHRSTSFCRHFYRSDHHTRTCCSTGRARGPRSHPSYACWLPPNWKLIRVLRCKPL